MRGYDLFDVIVYSMLSGVITTLLVSVWAFRQGFKAGQRQREASHRHDHTFRANWR